MLILQARVVDPTHLELSEPIALERGECVVVSVAQAEDKDVDRDTWLSASAVSLAAAYGAAEPDYTSCQAKEANPEYKP